MELKQKQLQIFLQGTASKQCCTFNRERERESYMIHSPRMEKKIMNPADI
jgi:hypothetical protein